MKWFKIRELPTTSTWLDQPIFSPFPARPGCPTKTSNDGGPQRESGESDVILSFQSAPAPVRAHAHTHARTGHRQKFEGCLCEVGEKLLVYRCASRPNRKEGLSVACVYVFFWCESLLYHAVLFSLQEQGLKQTKRCRSTA